MKLNGRRDQVGDMTMGLLCLCLCLCLAVSQTLCDGDCREGDSLGLRVRAEWI